MEFAGWIVALFFFVIALGIVLAWWAEERNDKLEKRIIGDVINGQVMPIVRQKMDIPQPQSKD